MLRSVKTRAERATAPIVGRVARIALSRGLPLPAKRALWWVANHNFFHYPAELCARTVSGHRMLCRLDDFVQRHIAIFGTWEPALTQYLLDKQRVDGIFLDIGANVGYFSLLASKVFSEVVAFEPSPSIFAKLQENIARNGVSNITAHQVAISDESRNAPFYYSSNSNSGGSSLHMRDNRIFEGNVQCAPIQRFVTEEQWPRVRFVKVDVEGHELQVITSLLQSASRFDATTEIAMEFDPSEDARRALVALKSAGFIPYDLRSAYKQEDYFGTALPAPPLSLSSVPTALTDLLFKRQSKPHMR